LEKMSQANKARRIAGIVYRTNLGAGEGVEPPNFSSDSLTAGSVVSLVFRFMDSSFSSAMQLVKNRGLL
jgi:hypothetical protein